MAIEIEKLDYTPDDIGDLVGRAFEEYGEKNGIDCDYVSFCFVAKDGEKVLGVVQGHAYYNEVHVGDLIVMEDSRKSGIGTKLMLAVEEAFTGKGRININLTTYAFQAPEFYKKLGYEVEYVRKNPVEKLDKYFLIKRIG
ncbi:MAG: GNAT family N-acetyltransferase [Clostridiales bacterium]|nr:GNAT family N-acetyltransferase [Clostridiales bacterium]